MDIVTLLIKQLQHVTGDEYLIEVVYFNSFLFFYNKEC